MLLLFVVLQCRGSGTCSSLPDVENTHGGLSKQGEMGAGVSCAGCCCLR
jgi:hypothetical protein